MINIERFQKVLDYTTEHLADWNQSIYGSVERSQLQKLDGVSVGYASCGTAGCIAGNTIFLDERYVVLAPVDVRIGTPTVVLHHCVLKENLDRVSDTHQAGEPSQYIEGIGTAAAKLLGLTSSKADLLFWSSNDLLNIWALAYWIADGEIRLPEILPSAKWYPMDEGSPQESERIENVPAAILERWDSGTIHDQAEYMDICLDDGLSPGVIAKLQGLAATRKAQLSLLDLAPSQGV